MTTPEPATRLGLFREYLNGYVAKLQTPGGVVYFFRDHRGKPIVSPALFEPIGEKFRKDIRDWAQANGIPVIRFTAGQRKAEVMAPYLEAAAVAGRSQVVAVGCAQEFQLVWTARKRDTDPGGCPQFSFKPIPAAAACRLAHSCPESRRRDSGQYAETAAMPQGADAPAAGYG